MPAAAKSEKTNGCVIGHGGMERLRKCATTTRPREKKNTLSHFSHNGQHVLPVRGAKPEGRVEISALCRRRRGRPGGLDRA